jgi:hypothetical protein
MAPGLRAATNQTYAIEY